MTGIFKIKGGIRKD